MNHTFPRILKRQIILLLWLIVTISFINMTTTEGKPVKSSEEELVEDEEHDIVGSAVVPTFMPSTFHQAHSIAIRHGLYGAAAGSCQVITLMWLRTIVNYQYRYGITMAEAAAALYKEGGIGRFYRGLPYALIQNPLSKFGAVAANEGSKVIVAHLSSSGVPSALLSSTLGTMLSVMWKLLLIPLETIKTVLQVNGQEGFKQLIAEVWFKGNIMRLFRGSMATILSTVSSHYPWFYVHNLLDNLISKPSVIDNVNYPRDTIIRSALIGFIASAVSDCISNVVRVVKTLRQTMSDNEDSNYVSIISNLYRESGLYGLMGRGLGTRVLSNGLQSIIFTIVWKLIPLYMAHQQQQKTVNREVEGNESNEEIMDISLEKR